MRVGIFTHSAIGDTMMALPLIQGLRRGGHHVALIGKEQIRPFYEYLERENIISEGITYRSVLLPPSPTNGGAPNSKAIITIPKGTPIRNILGLLEPKWRLRMGQLDVLLIPWEIRRYVRLSFRLVMEMIPMPILAKLLGVRHLHFIEEATVIPQRLGVPPAINRTVSYIRCLENEFHREFQLDSLFLPDDTLRRAEEKARKLLSSHHLTAGSYAVLYPATQELQRSMPNFLVARIMSCAKRVGLETVLIGSRDHGFPITGSNVSATIDLRGPLEFEEIFGLMCKSRINLAVDGGLLYMALAVRNPVVSFWGSTIPESRVLQAHPHHHALSRHLTYPRNLHLSKVNSMTEAAFDFSENEIANAVLAGMNR
jgi:ADP-heptose:LPS heptosyltransferase